MKFWFWFLWSINAFIAAVALYFFFALGAGGRVGSFNILPWLAILAALTAVVGGSVWLRSAGQPVVVFLDAPADELWRRCQGHGGSVRPLLQNRDDGFFTLPGEDRELDPARLNVEHGVRRIPLRKKRLVLFCHKKCFAAADG